MHLDLDEKCGFKNLTTASWEKAEGAPVFCAAPDSPPSN